MALDAGTVDVDDDGNATGSGLALDIFNGAMSGLGGEVKAAIGNGMKGFCEGIATAIVDHLKNNAEITITVQPTDSGLQSLPSVLTPGSPTDGPASPKTFTGSIV
jgi:hypothetical protein